MTEVEFAGFGAGTVTLTSVLTVTFVFMGPVGELELLGPLGAIEMLISGSTTTVVFEGTGGGTVILILG
jgi:hypothetical protein